MTRWHHPPHAERARKNDSFDPVVEGARHGLSRELALALWARIRAEADLGARGDADEAQRRFHDIAAGIAARGGRLVPDAGRITRVDLELDADLRDAGSAQDREPRAPGKDTRVAIAPVSDWLRAHLRWHGVARPLIPGRQTLVGSEARSRLAFDDYRVLGLRELLTWLGPDHALRGEVIAAASGADRSIAGRATRWREPLPSAAVQRPATPAPAPAPHGAALWHAAERHAVTLYRRAVKNGAVNQDDPAVDAALRQRGGGQSLPERLRVEMERKLRTSLAGVRIHTDGVAAQAARALDAAAFTVGEDIFFASGAYAPDTPAGRKLLIHELTHVAQANRHGPAGAPPGLRISHPDEPHEQEAEAAAEQAAQPAPAPAPDDADSAADSAAAPDTGDTAGEPDRERLTKVFGRPRTAPPDPEPHPEQDNARLPGQVDRAAGEPAGAKHRRGKRLEADDARAASAVLETKRRQLSAARTSQADPRANASETAAAARGSGEPVAAQAGRARPARAKPDHAATARRSSGDTAMARAEGALGATGVDRPAASSGAPAPAAAATNTGALSTDAASGGAAAPAAAAAAPLGAAAAPLGAAAATAALSTDAAVATAATGTPAAGAGAPGSDAPGVASGSRTVQDHGGASAGASGTAGTPAAAAAPGHTAADAPVSGGAADTHAASRPGADPAVGTAPGRKPDLDGGAARGPHDAADPHADGTRASWEQHHAGVAGRIEPRPTNLPAAPAELKARLASSWDDIYNRAGEHHLDGRLPASGAAPQIPQAPVLDKAPARPAAEAAAPPTRAAAATTPAARVASISAAGTRGAAPALDASAVPIGAAAPAGTRGAAPLLDASAVSAGAAAAGSQGAAAMLDASAVPAGAAAGSQGAAAMLDASAVPAGAAAAAGTRGAAPALDASAVSAGAAAAPAADATAAPAANTSPAGAALVPAAHEAAALPAAVPPARALEAAAPPAAGMPAPAAAPDHKPASHELLSQLSVQAKLAVSSVDDPHEREADDAADAVLAGPDDDAAEAPVVDVSSGGVPQGRVHRKAAHGAERGDGSDEIADRLAGRVSDLRSGGAPLPARERTFFESRFGRDFSDVRVHAGPDATRLAGDLGARAFTVGSHIAFGSGEYSPGSSAGRRLLAHELAHVVQQTQGRARSTVGRSRLAQAIGIAGNAAALARVVGGAAAAGARDAVRAMAPVALSAAATQVQRFSLGDLNPLEWAKKALEALTGDADAGKSELQGEGAAKQGEIDGQARTKGGELDGDGQGKGGELDGDGEDKGTELDGQGKDKGTELDGQGKDKGGEIDEQGRTRGSEVEAGGRERGGDVEAAGRERGAEVDAAGRERSGQLEAEARERGAQLETESSERRSQVEAEASAKHQELDEAARGKQRELQQHGEHKGEEIHRDAESKHQEVDSERVRTELATHAEQEATDKAITDGANRLRDDAQGRSGEVEQGWNGLHQEATGIVGRLDAEAGALCSKFEGKAKAFVQRLDQGIRPVFHEIKEDLDKLQHEAERAWNAFMDKVGPVLKQIEQKWTQFTNWVSKNVWDPLTQKASELARWAGDLMTKAWNKAKQAWDFLQKKAQAAFNWIKDKVLAAINWLKGLGEAATNWIHGKAAAARAWIKGKADAARAWIHGKANAARAWIHGKADAARAWIHGKASAARAWIHGKANAARSWIHGKADAARSWIHGKADAAKSWIHGKADAAKSWIHGKADAAKGWIHGKADAARGWIKGKASAASGWLRDKGHGLVNGIASKAHGLVNALSSKGGPIMQWLAGAVNGLISGVASVGNGAVDLVSGALGRGLQFVEDRATGAINWVESKATGAVSWVESKATGAVRWVENKATGAVTWVENKATGAVTWVENKATGAINLLERAATTGVNVVERGATGAVNLLERAASGAVTLVEGAALGAVSFVEGAVKVAIGAVGLIGYGAYKLVEGAWHLVQGAWDKISGWLGQAWDWAKQKLSELGSWLNEHVIQPSWNWLKQQWASFQDWFKSTFPGLVKCWEVFKEWAGTIGAYLGQLLTELMAWFNALPEWMQWLLCLGVYPLSQFPLIMKAWNSLPENVRGVLHSVLDILGLIPGYGAIADVINSLLYLAEGDFLNAALGLLFAIPGLGDVAEGGKILKDTGKLLKSLAPDALNALRKLDKKELLALIKKGPGAILDWLKRFGKGGEDAAARAAREKAEREAADRAAREAADRAAREAADKAARDKAEKDAADRAARDHGHGHGGNDDGHGHGGGNDDGHGHGGGGKNDGGGGGKDNGGGGGKDDGHGGKGKGGDDDGQTIPGHPSNRLGEPSSADIKAIRKKYNIDSDSEAAAIWAVEHQRSTAGVVAGEREIKKVLGIDPNKPGEKMTDLLKTDNQGLKIPIEVKNQKEIHLDGKGNSALAKFENIARQTNMAQIDHFEVLVNTGSKLPPNFRVDATGKLSRLVSGSEPPVFEVVEIGGKNVYIKGANLGEISK